LPVIREAIKQPFTAALLKGRGNYLRLRWPKRSRVPSMKTGI
jgi:hypothetical protein